ncbi:MAG TPA: phosphoesterase, partial [Terracidiphilus sp.]
FWADTAFFIVEDDAQAGADHVDAHRSTALVISKYAPHGPAGAPFVDSRFYTTVSMIRTMEMLLDLPPMNNNDAFASVFAPLFTGTGDQPAFDADYSNRDNNLIYTANKRTAPGAQESMKMDFRHADHADTQKLNVILWKDTMGDKPVPAMLKVPVKRATKDKDDD